MSKIEKYLTRDYPPMTMDDYYESMAQNILIKESDTHYRLAREGGGHIMSVSIIFDAGRIIITGDWSPGKHGAISALGYGVRWFSGKLNQDYLGSKFLDREWDADRARWDLGHQLSEIAKEAYDHRDRPTLKSGKKLRQITIDNHYFMFDSGYAFHDAMQEWDQEWHEYGIGMGYNERDHGMLCAINRRFSELYSEASDASV